MKPIITDILKKLPHKPGVYLMKDKTGTIIYTGKSVNLKSRVSSYFMENASLNFAKKKMVEKVIDIEWIETSSEIEALVLETNYIKKHLPKYNILMKDDKNLTYIKITDDPIPEVIKTRKKDTTVGHSEYFGPYTSSTNITITLKALRQIFRVRSCRVTFAEHNGKLEIVSRAGRSIPCLDFYIGICPAPCVLEKTKLDEHKQNVDAMKNFLKGNTARVLSDLEEKMRTHAKKLEFEEAAKIKLQVESIRDISVRQIARDAIEGDCDAFIYFEKYDRIFAGISQVRNGEIVSVRNVEIETKLGETKDEIIAEFLGQEYASNSTRLILLVNEELSPDITRLLEVLHVFSEIPSIGPKRAFLDFAKTNIFSYANKLELSNIGKKFLTKATQVNILTALGYEVPKKGPIIFECYDISHIAGAHTVASRSVIINGKSETGKYKRYKIKTLESGQIDDFESMREVLTRRTKEAIVLKNWPNLIIIDGGKGQLSASFGAIEGEMKYEELSLPNICSIAKREEEVFIPHTSEPILFQKGTPELMLIQKIRDEAHRFAITFNRESRNKAMKKNILEELPGFGPKTRSKLLKLAGSVDAIKNHDEKELLTVISHKQLEILRDHGIL